MTSGGFTYNWGQEAPFLTRQSAFYEHYFGVVLGNLLGYIPYIGQVLGIIADVSPSIETCNIKVPHWDTKLNSADIIVEYETPADKIAMEVMQSSTAANKWGTTIFRYVTERGYDYFAFALDSWGANGYKGRDVNVRFERWQPDKALKQKYTLRVTPMGTNQ